ncbi:MAG TPA: S9 family peptidase [Thermomicrobiales bacterium]|jgi:dipeptidyl aminopeptidase/acylaminoacyl peptidase
MTRRLTPDTLVYDLTWAANPQVSPDAVHVVYEVTTTGRDTKKSATHLWLRNIDGAAPRQLTRSGERNGGARWSPDGRRLAFTSDRVKTAGIFVLSLDGGDAREVTRHRAAIGGLAWSPDGRSVAYSAIHDPDNADEKERPEGTPEPVRATRRADYKHDTRGYLGDTRSQVWIVDLETGTRRMLTSDANDHNHPAWSPDGRTIAAMVPNSNYLSSQLALIAVDSGATTMVGAERGVIGSWAWSPDGRRIVFAGEPTRTWQLDFFLYDVASGETRQLTDDLAVLPGQSWSVFVPAAQPVWLDDRRVLFAASRAGRSGLYLLNTETGGVETVKEWQAQHGGFGVDVSRRFVAQGESSFETAGEIVIYDQETGTSRQITEQNGSLLRETSTATWENFTVQRGEFAIEAWLLKPPGFDPARRYPLVLDVHGGPNGFYGPDFSYVQQMLASHGFLVVFANPRGSASYGRHFTQQVVGDWGGEDFRDLMAVVDEVLARPYVDPDRTGIFGYSYGGYMTSWTIGHTDRFRAAVCGAPVFDLESQYGTSDLGYFWGDLQWEGKPHESRDWYVAHSPATFAHQAKTPTLILHAEGDIRCPIGQGEQLYATLLAAGCEAEFVRYPGGNHLFLWGGEPTYVEDFMRRTLEWFRCHLGEPA